MYRSAVFKLTLYYVALLMGLALVFSTALYFVNHQEVAAGLKSQVHRYDIDGDHDSDSQEIYNDILKQRSRHFAEQVFYYDMGFVVVSIVIANLLARQTLKPIRKAHEEQIMFLADASHQLKTPLANMLLSSELNLSKVKDQSSKDYKKVLKQNIKDVQNLNSLTDGLLNIARHQSSLSRLNLQRVDIRSLVRDSIKDLNRLATIKHIKIEVSVHRTFVFVDKTAFKQVFTMLIENAIKYSEKNSLIEISSLNDYRKVIVKIVDHGHGISASDLSRIFKPFYRSSDAVVKDEDGFGLGLPLAKQIIELHGGKITVSSEVDKGSVFSVYIPRHTKAK